MQSISCLRGFKAPLALAAVLPLLMACSLTLPVTGTSEAGDEMFTGSATGYLDGGGTLEIKSTKGADCKGTFVYQSRREGRGTFTCTDGRSGPFEFVSTGTRGTGTGRLGDRRFTFNFG
jgi:hypothetical protein